MLKIASLSWFVMVVGECDKGARRDKIRLSEDQKNRRTKIQTIHYYMDSQGQVKQVEGDSNFLD